LDLNLVLEVLQASHARHGVSLDEPVGDKNSSTGRNRFEAVIARPDPEIDLIEYRETLGPLLADLPHRERRILLLRFFADMSQTEIAKQVGISQMHVSRLLSATLAKLRPANPKPANRPPAAAR
jgi:RNA polymerase sigma-B factor